MCFKQCAQRLFISLEPEKINAIVEFPVPIYGTINNQTEQWFHKIRMTLFHLNKANARTVHKLQGERLKYVVINSFRDFGHLAYVALSHMKVLISLFLQSPVDFSKCTGMDHQVSQFVDKMIQQKKYLRPIVYCSENRTLSENEKGTCSILC
jgi:hypothetical protein